MYKSHPGIKVQLFTLKSCQFSLLARNRCARVIRLGVIPSKYTTTGMQTRRNIHYSTNALVSRGRTGTERYSQLGRVLQCIYPTFCTLNIQTPSSSPSAPRALRARLPYPHAVTPYVWHTCEIRGGEARTREFRSSSALQAAARHRIAPPELRAFTSFRRPPSSDRTFCWPNRDRGSSSRTPVRMQIPSGARIKEKHNEELFGSRDLLPSDFSSIFSKCTSSLLRLLPCSPRSPSPPPTSTGDPPSLRSTDQRRLGELQPVSLRSVRSVSPFLFQVSFLLFYFLFHYTFFTVFPLRITAPSHLITGPP